MAKKVVGSLGGIIGHALERGQVAQNVVAQRSLRRARRLEQRHDKRLEVGVDIPSKDELRAMLNGAQGRWRALIVTAIFTGLRASELRGLTWKDVDPLDAAVVTVRQRADRYLELGSPKSRTSQREVPLAPMVVNTLKEWKLACPKGELDLVFPRRDGTIVSHAIVHDWLGALQVKLGIGSDPRKPKYGLHSLRHACASLWIEDGRSPKQVQAWMGHSTIGMTFDVYGHLFPKAEDDAATMARVQARLVG